MQNISEYSKKLRASLSPEVARVFSKLTSPAKVQDYLDSLAINFDLSGDLLSSKRIVERERAQCIEGAMFAAAALAYHGDVPLLLDFQTSSYDEDHVVALFKREGKWGAISKTNHAILRWRDPVYESIRELAMSYFHEYYMHDGRKTMRAFSKPFDMRRYKPEFWVMSGESLEQIAEDLDSSKHFPAVTVQKMRTLRRASDLEIKLLDVVEWKRPK
jgi:hypothetical protein